MSKALAKMLAISILSNLTLWPFPSFHASGGWNQVVENKCLQYSLATVLGDEHPELIELVIQFLYERAVRVNVWGEPAALASGREGEIGRLRGETVGPFHLLEDMGKGLPKAGRYAFTGRPDPSLGEWQCCQGSSWAECWHVASISTVFCVKFRIRQRLRHGGTGHEPGPGSRAWATERRDGRRPGE